MSCNLPDAETITCVITLTITFTVIPVDFIGLSQSLFNSINRARSFPIYFAAELHATGSVDTAIAVAANPSVGQVEYRGTLRQVAKEFFSDGKLFPAHVFPGNLYDIASKYASPVELEWVRVDGYLRFLDKLLDRSP